MPLFSRPYIFRQFLIYAVRVLDGKSSPDTSLQASREECETIVCNCMDQLLEKTKLVNLTPILLTSLTDFNVLFPRLFFSLLAE